MLSKSLTAKNFTVQKLLHRVLWNHGELHASICFPSQDTLLQTIKIDISKYSQLCIEAGFFQIHLHFMYQ